MGKISLEEAIQFIDGKFDKDIWEEAINLAEGTLAHLEEIDAQIQDHSKGWDIQRLVATDRNILKLAIYELLYRKETPVAVVIDQALKLADKYSTNDSMKFINGVLGAVERSLYAEESPRSD